MGTALPITHSFKLIMTHVMLIATEMQSVGQVYKKSNLLAKVRDDKFVTMP